MRRNYAAPPLIGAIGATLLLRQRKTPLLSASYSSLTAAAWLLVSTILVLSSTTTALPTSLALPAITFPCASAAPLLSGDRFAFGCLESSTEIFFLAVFFRSTADPSHAQAVWTANPTRSVSSNASFLFSSSSGQLDLSDNGASPAWSLSFQAASPPVTITLHDSGNLLILDSTNSLLWQSFLHPLDLLLPGQIMTPGMKLSAGSQSVFTIDAAEANITFTAVVEPAGFALFANFTDSRSLRYSVWNLASEFGHVDDAVNNSSSCSGSIDGSDHSTELQLSHDASQLLLRSCIANVSMNRSITFGAANHQTVDFLRLDLDGNMRGYKYDYGNATWLVVYDWFVSNTSSNARGICNLPSICGPYGMCNTLAENKCSCPYLSSTDEQLFFPVNKSDSSQGCRLAHPLNCSVAKGSYYFIELQGADYFANDALSSEHISRSTEQECLASCAENCACKMAFYRADTRACFQYEQVLSIIGVGNATKLFEPSPVAGNKTEKAAHIIQRFKGRSASSVVQFAAQSTDLMRLGNSSADEFSKYVGFLKVKNSLVQDMSPVAELASTKSGKRRNLIITLGSAVAGLFLLLVTIGLLCVCFKKRRRRFKALRDEEFYINTLPGQHMVHFTFAQLQEASGDFKCKLGVGGFGSVYKGTLPDGSTVAIKQLENAVRADQEFESQVTFLQSLSHPNLIRLIGFCSNGLRRLLISEHILHGSLDAWLFNKPINDKAFLSSSSTHPNSPLDWKTRFSIALDVARGLAFLHENSLVHHAIKPQNILLDDGFVAKLSDYGLSRLMDQEEGSLILHMRGTTGYMAPEWLQHACATEKSDVYSYGMVLMELLGGRRNVDLSKERESWFFPLLAAKMYKEGRVQEVLDETLTKSNTGPMGEGECKQAQRVMQIAFWCIVESPAKRPDMASILFMLQGTDEVPEPPLPLFFNGRSTHDPTMSNLDDNHQFYNGHCDQSGASSPSCFNISLTSEPLFAAAGQTLWSSGEGHLDDCSLLLPSQD